MSKLNAEQMAVVESTAKNILVIAGPGAGKSTTLVARIMRKIGQGFEPGKMVAITFTNAAAKELTERLGEGIELFYVGTLHGFCLRLLQEFASEMGYGQRLNIVDEEQAEELLKNVASQLKCKTSIAKLNELKATGPYAGTLKIDQLVINTYFNKLRQNSTLDFDMILSEAKRFIKDYWRTGTASKTPELEFLYVDEFQDSCNMDFWIYDALPIENKFYVGDPDQSIYGFRGGNVNHIIQMQNKWYMPVPSENEVHFLERNHRSYPAICKHADTLIAQNKNRVLKSTIAVKTEMPGIVEVKECASDLVEAATIIEMLRGIDNPENAAVLCRGNKLAADLAKAAMGAGIPVRRKPVNSDPKDWHIARLALRILANPSNETAVYFWLSKVKNKEYADDARRQAAIKQKPLIEMSGLIPLPATIDNYARRLIQMNVSLESVEKIEDYAGEMVNPTLTEIIFAISRDLDSVKEQGHGVTFTTIHAAKGREWNDVILAGFEQSTIPGGSKSRDIEEERRVAFVGLTRARERVRITYARMRPQVWGNHKPEPTEASQFIGEMGL